MTPIAPTKLGHCREGTSFSLPRSHKSPTALLPNPPLQAQLPPVYHLNGFRAHLFVRHS
ncbi:hypothetical protein CBM2605_A260046 [Cupriavidus neocaledonicus]|uniref:Uncharacterized protein n=1 Tax=Cupriavidus neocaledonicus TaxID=1040979 RepID=A0ABY1V1N7_9BURK|nr:hypothetical protein CBM2605_A260046 [Cupriavidus neocaledonicus]